MPFECLDGLDEMLATRKSVVDALRPHSAAYEHACTALFGHALDLWTLVFVPVLDERFTLKVRATITASFARYVLPSPSIASSSYVQDVRSGSAHCDKLCAHPSVVLDSHARLRAACSAVDALVVEYGADSSTVARTFDECLDE